MQLNGRTFFRLSENIFPTCCKSWPPCHKLRFILGHNFDLQVGLDMQQGGLNLWQVGKIIKVALSAALEPTAARDLEPRSMLCLKKWPDTSTERKVYHWLLGRNWRRGSDRRSSETSSTSSRQRRPRQAGRSWCTNRQKIRRIFPHIFLKKQTSSLYNAIAVSIFRVSLMQCKIKCSVFSRNSEAK